MIQKSTRSLSTSRDKQEAFFESELERSSFKIDDSFSNDEMNPLHFQVKNLQRLLVDEQGEWKCGIKEQVEVLDHI